MASIHEGIRSVAGGLRHSARPWAWALSLLLGVSAVQPATAIDFDDLEKLEKVERKERREREARAEAARRQEEARKQAERQAQEAEARSRMAQSGGGSDGWRSRPVDPRKFRLVQKGGQYSLYCGDSFVTFMTRNGNLWAGTYTGLKDSFEEAATLAAKDTYACRAD